MRIEEIKTGPVDRDEVRRYMGYYHVSGWEKQPGDVFDPAGRAVYADADPLIERAVMEAEKVLENKVISCRYPLELAGDRICFGSAQLVSADLAKRLAGCRELVLFAATSGFGLDRLIEKYKRIEPSLSYALSCVGTEHTEALCDGFCEKLAEEVKAEGLSLTQRYSPGYGDLGLEVQPVLFSELDLTRKLGITLNASYLMTPVKSVTAIVGLTVRGDGSPG